MRKVVKAKDKKGNLIIPSILNNHNTNYEWESIAKKETKPPASMKTSKDVIRELDKYYFGKCAYCETYCNAEVEHYRPKNHYYWLYYEWTNLLPACHDCNTIGTGKGTQFPVIGKQETKPQFETKTNKLNKSYCLHNKFPLKAEKPYLLHPEYDNPKDFLAFKINDQFVGIDIIGIDSKEKGEKTLNICNLNREPLRKNRQSIVVEHILEQLRDTFLDCKEEGFSYEKILKKLLKRFVAIKRKALDITLQYTLLYDFVIESSENFEKIILPYYTEEPETQKTIAAAFKLYKEFEY